MLTDMHDSLNINVIVLLAVKQFQPRQAEKISTEINVTHADNRKSI